MARLVWNVAGSRYFEAGVDRGVLYVESLAGVPWIGLISVDENPAGAEISPFYIDGRKFQQISTNGEFEGTIRAFTYPIEFSKCDGTESVRDGLFFGQQPRSQFGLSYRTLVGNDTEGINHGYKIHLVYNAMAVPSTRSSNSFANSIDPTEFTWDISTKALVVSGHAPTAHVVVDSRYTHPENLSDIEDILYGTDESPARLPTPEEVLDIFDTPLVYSVTDNGNGTFLVGGPNENVVDIGLGQYIIDHETVEIIDEDMFTLTY